MRGINSVWALNRLLATVVLTMVVEAPTSAAPGVQDQRATEAIILLGQSVESLLEFAKEKNPEFAAMRLEAEAAVERITPAGALPDPKLKVELQDITMSGERTATLSPSRVGSTRYTLMQELPWFGKRDLQREIATLDSEGAQVETVATWAELAAKIKATHAQRYYLHRNEMLIKEIFDLMIRLEKVAQVRYASGVAAQQDVIRAQIEQTNIKIELGDLQSERRLVVDTRLNALLARPADALFADPEHLRPLPPASKLDHATLEARVRTRNPELFKETYRVKAAEKKRELTYKNRYPDFALGIAPVQMQDSVAMWELMLELNIPLQQATRRAEEREAELMLQAARARQEATANKVVAELSENLAGIEVAQRLEKLTMTNLLPQAELTFSAALAAYETGSVDFSTLLDAQRQIRQAKQNQIKAQAEAQMRIAEIERLLGEDL